jgi:hypothetical protein
LTKFTRRHDSEVSVSSFSSWYILRASIDFEAQAQTPQQKRANQLYEKREAAKRGKPLSETKKAEVKKAPISKYWIGTSEVETLISSGIVVCIGRRHHF